MYPWQSGSDGEEETQVVHLNPRFRVVGAGPEAATSGTWARPSSTNIWHYIQATGDTDFLLGPGAEMMLEIAPLLV